MCEPFTMAALAITTTAATIYTQNKAASAAEAAIREQLSVAEREITNQEVAEVNDRLRQARKEQARIKVAAGEAGLQLGGSIELLLKDSLMQAQLARERIGMNATAQRHNVRAEANSMLSRIQKDTALGAGLKLASAGVSGWSQGQSLQIARDRIATEAGRKAGS